MAHTNRAVPASYLILEKDGKVLMSRRKNTNYLPGYYQLPAGHVDEGELPVDCIIREAKEEVGISIQPEEIEFAHVSYRPKHDNTADRVDFFFYGRKWQGEIKNTEPDKASDWEWIDIAKLPEKILPQVKDAIFSSKNKMYFRELNMEFLKTSGVVKR